jgi:hypothetical protein
MALLPNAFKPSEASDNVFEVLKGGWYKAAITKSEVKKTADKTGKYIALKFVIEDEDNKSNDGRIVFTNLNTVNKNPVAVKIAERDLKSICKACDLPIDDPEFELEDTEDLHGITMWIKLSVKEETSQWPAKNEIKAYRHIDDDPTSDDSED